MKYLKYLTLASLSLIGTAWAQNTNPVHQVFPIRGYERVQAIDKGLSGLLPASSAIWGRSGELTIFAFSPNQTDGVDSVFFTKDSLSVLTGETVYQFEVTAQGYASTVTNDTDNNHNGSDTTLTLKIHRNAYGVDSTATYTVWKNNANRRVIDNLGFTFESDVKPGDKFTVMATYDVSITADRTTGAVVTADYGLHALFEGLSYTVGVDSALGGGDDTLEIALVMPSGEDRYVVCWEVSLLPDVNPDTVNGWAYFKSGITVGVATDTVTVRNDDFASNSTSGVVAIKAPRSIATGTVYTTQAIGSGFKIESGFRIFNSATTYGIGVHTTGAAEASILIRLLKVHGP